MMHRVDQPFPPLLDLRLPPFEKDVPSITSTSPLQWRLDMEEADWRIVLYWIAKKKWHPQLKIPLKPKLANLYAPRGEMFYRGLELCIACHASSHPNSQIYKHAAYWYENIIREAKHLSIKTIIANRADGKTHGVRERYDIMKAFKESENPVNPISSPCLHQLIEVALWLETSKDFITSNDFNQNYWQPFLRACSQSTQATEKPTCRSTHIVGDRIVERVGQGRGVMTVLNLA